MTMVKTTTIISLNLVLFLLHVGVVSCFCVLTHHNNAQRLSQRRGDISVDPSRYSRRIATKGSRSSSEDDGAVVGSDDASRDRRAAEDLLARAREIRESLPTTSSSSSSSSTTVSTTSDADVESSPPRRVVPYRLYLDVGREPGTWMDPRWGASGARVEAAVDVEFALKEDEGVDAAIADKMVKDNLVGRGRSSAVRRVACPKGSVRLRGGFDSMACEGGAYRLDRDRGATTVRFFLDVAGTSEGGAYGDVSVPKGCLYFSIPCFGNSVSNLSTKESPLTVRQMGWHTGFRRMESRIVGVFKAVPLDKARQRDGY